MLRPQNYLLARLDAQVFRGDNEELGPEGEEAQLGLVGFRESLDEGHCENYQKQRAILLIGKSITIINYFRIFTKTQSATTGYGTWLKL